MSSNSPYSIRSSRRSIRILLRRRNSSRVSPDWFGFELRVSLLATKKEREWLFVDCRRRRRSFKSTKVDFHHYPIRCSVVGCRAYEKLYAKRLKGIHPYAERRKRQAKKISWLKRRNSPNSQTALVLLLLLNYNLLRLSLLILHLLIFNIKTSAIVLKFSHPLPFPRHKQSACDSSRLQFVLLLGRVHVYRRLAHWLLLRSENFNPPFGGLTATERRGTEAALNRNRKGGMGV